MRLVDADYLKEALSIFNAGNPHFLNGIETAREIIDNAPTVEALYYSQRRNTHEDA